MWAQKMPDAEQIICCRISEQGLKSMEWYHSSTYPDKPGLPDKLSRSDDSQTLLHKSRWTKNLNKQKKV